MKLISEEDLRQFLYKEEIFNDIWSKYYSDELISFVNEMEDKINEEKIDFRLSQYPDYKEKEFDNYNYD